MARKIRIIKDKDGKDVEIYSDICFECKKEMIFPKKEADQIEEMFPFIKDKIERGTPCLDCAKKQASEGSFSLYSEEELQQIRKKALELDSKDEVQS